MNEALFLRFGDLYGVEVRRRARDRLLRCLFRGYSSGTDVAQEQGLSDYLSRSSPGNEQPERRRNQPAHPAPCEYNQNLDEVGIAFSACATSGPAHD